MAIDLIKKNDLPENPFLRWEKLVSKFLLVKCILDLKKHISVSVSVESEGQRESQNKDICIYIQLYTYYHGSGCYY